MSFGIPHSALRISIVLLSAFPPVAVRSTKFLTVRNLLTPSPRRSYDCVSANSLQWAGRAQPQRGEILVALRIGGDDVGPVPSPGGGSGGQKGMPGQGTRPTVSPSPPRTRWPLAPTSASAFRPAFRIPPWPRAAPPTREGERPRKPHRFQAIRIPHSPKCNHG